MRRKTHAGALDEEIFAAYTRCCLASPRRTSLWRVALPAGLVVKEAEGRDPAFFLESGLQPIALAQGNDWVPQFSLQGFLGQPALLYQELFPEGADVNGKLVTLVVQRRLVL